MRHDNKKDEHSNGRYSFSMIGIEFSSMLRPTGHKLRQLKSLLRPLARRHPPSPRPLQRWQVFFVVPESLTRVAGIFAVHCITRLYTFRSK